MSRVTRSWEAISRRSLSADAQSGFVELPAVTRAELHDLRGGVSVLLAQDVRGGNLGAPVVELGSPLAHSPWPSSIHETTDAVVIGRVVVDPSHAHICFCVTARLP